jgi:hypothetical protein
MLLASHAEVNAPDRRFPTGLAKWTTALISWLSSPTKAHPLRTKKKRRGFSAPTQKRWHAVFHLKKESKFQIFGILLALLEVVKLFTFQLRSFNGLKEHSTL